MNSEAFLENEKLQLIKGGLGFMVLGIIKNNPNIYGGKILDLLQKTSFETQEGTLYPLLAKLRRWGLIDYTWQESPTGPPRKCYKLTRAGMQHHQSLVTFWQDVSDQLLKNTQKEDKK